MVLEFEICLVLGSCDLKFWYKLLDLGSCDLRFLIIPLKAKNTHYLPKGD